MLLETLQKYSDEAVAEDWLQLKGKLESTAKTGTREFTFYDRPYYEKDSDLSPSTVNVFKSSKFDALIDMCSSEGLNPERSIFNNKATGVNQCTVSW